MNATARIVTATKELVDSLLAMNINNRPMRKGVVDCYKQDISDGRWLVTNQGIGIDANGVLVDGQHRLEALKEMGYPPIQLLIVSGLDPQVRSVIDQHAKRSVRDIWRLVLDHNVGSQAPAICSVIYRAKTKFSKMARISPQRLKDVLDEHSEEIQFVLENIQNTSKWAAPFLAAFVVIIKEHPIKTQEVAQFIARVSCGENLTRKMPEYHFRNYLMTNRGQVGGGAVQQERYQKAIRALMASLNGEEMGVLRASY
jgi:hypothetical protein